MTDTADSPVEASIESLLSVRTFAEIPGIRAFARRVDDLWDGTEILERAWRRAVTEVESAGAALSSVLPDWEAISVRWAAFVQDVRDFVRDALRSFRATAQYAVEHLNGLLREFNEWLGLSAMWVELREWILRELRAFRGGRTLSERLETVERSAGATLVLVGLAAVGGLGLWGWWEWRKRSVPLELMARAGGDDDSIF